MLPLYLDCYLIMLFIGCSLARSLACSLSWNGNFVDAKSFLQMDKLQRIDHRCFEALPPYPNLSFDSSQDHTMSGKRFVRSSIQIISNELLCQCLCLCRYVLHVCQCLVCQSTVVVVKYEISSLINIIIIIISWIQFEISCMIQCCSYYIDWLLSFFVLIVVVSWQCNINITTGILPHVSSIHKNNLCEKTYPNRFIGSILLGTIISNERIGNSLLKLFGCDDNPCFVSFGKKISFFDLCLLGLFIIFVGSLVCSLFLCLLTCLLTCLLCTFCVVLCCWFLECWHF